MRKFLFIAITIAMFLGCEKTEPIPEIFTFTLNEQEMDFSDNIKVSKNFFTNEIEIEARKTNVGLLKITLHDAKTGKFNESNYNFSFEDLTSNYSIYYEMNDSAQYFYNSSSTKSYFNINVDRFENVSKGELSGGFSAYLIGYLFNSDNAIDTVLIETGVFSTALEERLD